MRGADDSARTARPLLGETLGLRRREGIDTSIRPSRVGTADGDASCRDARPSPARLAQGTPPPATHGGDESATTAAAGGMNFYGTAPNGVLRTALAQRARDVWKSVVIVSRNMSSSSKSVESFRTQPTPATDTAGADMQKRPTAGARRSLSHGRMGRDSNPRYAFDVHTLSRRAP
jgi:hypothetical protein